MDRQTDTHTHAHTHRLTDANRFYYLSRAICYSYGADNNAFVRLPDFHIAVCLYMMLKNEITVILLSVIIFSVVRV